MPTLKSLLDKSLPKNIFLFLLFLALQACANSELGEKLSNSFDSPVQSSEDATSTQNIQSKNNSTIPTKDRDKEILQFNKMGSQENLTDNKSAPPVIYKKRVSKNRQKTSLLTLQPYRIIIRLSAANPSAPAETVTRALRDAGILFEVERIEIYNPKGFKNPNSIKR